MAFALVSAPEQDFENSRIRQMEWLKEQGFEVVEYKVVTKDNLDEAMQYFSTKIETNDFPSDGLVALYDDIAYGESLGTTAKFPRNAFAFKWADEQKETTLLEIEWSRREPVSSIRLRFLSRSSWKELRFPAQASTTSVSCVRWISVWVIKSLSTKQT